MAVPQQRNQKKHRSNRRAGYTVAQRRFTLDRLADKPSFEQWLAETPRPGDWLENESLRPTLEERLLRPPPMSFLDRPRSFLDPDEDYDPDIGNDLDDIADFNRESDFENEW